MSSVYSIIVAFNPDIEALQSLVDNLSRNSKKVIVANNSDYPISSSLIASHCPLVILEEGVNYGIAKAQSIAMKYSFDEGADFVFQMDQDSIPEDGLIVKLCDSYAILKKNNVNVGLIGPQDYYGSTNEINSRPIVNQKQIVKENLLDINTTLSSGSLIPQEVYLNVGGMRDDMFIDWVDSEFCWRIKSKGYKIIKDNALRINHKIGDGKKKVFGGCWSLKISSPFRLYYQFRNILLLMSVRYIPLKWKLFRLLKLTMNTFISFIYMKDRVVRLKYTCVGILHGITGRTGSYNSKNEKY